MRCRRVVERHGGTVEKFIGDAIMAVFGIPTLHEDDALRAVRAAAEMREALARLNEMLEREQGIRLTDPHRREHGRGRRRGRSRPPAARDRRCGQRRRAPRASGGAGRDPARGDDATGSCARPFAPSRSTPLALKGKSRPLPAWKLIEVLPDVPAFTRPIATPFVGRDGRARVTASGVRSGRQRADVRDRDDRWPAGDREVAPRTRAHRRARRDARVLVGRCLPYGEGITYAPLAEMVRQARRHRPRRRGSPSSSPAMVTRPRSRRGSSSAIGASDHAASAEEIAWAFRQALRGTARRSDRSSSPSTTSTGPSRRCSTCSSTSPAFGTAARSCSSASLARNCSTGAQRGPLRARTDSRLAPPLSAAETHGLIERLPRQRELDETRELASSTQRKAIRCSSSRSLRCKPTIPEQELVVPPTIQALLASRIDRLPPDERAVLSHASVEGRLFHRSAVAELLQSDARHGVGAQLLSLIRKEFVRPDRALFHGDDGFRFNHILIRDAAYDSHAEAAPRRAARALRAVARAAGEREHRGVRGVRRLPPRAVVSVAGGARTGRQPARHWRREPGGCWRTSAAVRQPAGMRAQRRACSGVRSTSWRSTRKHDSMCSPISVWRCVGAESFWKPSACSARRSRRPRKRTTSETRCEPRCNWRGCSSRWAATAGPSEHEGRPSVRCPCSSSSVTTESWPMRGSAWESSRR